MNVQEFLESTGTKVKFTFDQLVECPFMESKKKVNRYKVTISRNGKSMRSNFYDSIYSTEHHLIPSENDILCCLQTSDPGTFEEFCHDYGYNSDSIKDHQTYKAVCREWKKVERVFGDILEELSEIE